jgi:hypothetical protein
MWRNHRRGGVEGGHGQPELFVPAVPTGSAGTAVVRAILAGPIAGPTGGLRAGPAARPDVEEAELEGE